MNPVLSQGLVDPVFDQQATFRLVLDALARPGQMMTLPETIRFDLPSLPAGGAALILTLCDFETPLYLDKTHAKFRPWFAFHTGAPEALTPEGAAFALIDGRDAEISFNRFPVGEDRYPDHSATVIVTCGSLSDGSPVTLEGPGIETTITVAPTGLDARFWAEARANAMLYPLGIDLILVAGRTMMGLPRSTRISGAA